ncbi:MAG: DUF1700 domain-containing protein [Agathobacter sp.]|nr:DUF1700 domain-containing protein [Agathobacter sp.]
MRKDDFLNELERLLKDLPEGDRMDAIEYYYDYFDEAGSENEQKVIRELGSPERVAQTIKENFRASDYSEPNDYSEPGDHSAPNDYGAPEEREESYQAHKETYKQSSTASQETSSEKKTSWILIAIIAVLTFPLWIGVVAGLFGAVVGIIGGLFGVVVGLLGAAFGLIIGGIACCIAMIFQAAFIGPAEIMVTIGVCALLVALGLLFAWLFVMFVARWIPCWVRAIVKGIKSLVNRK